VYVVTIAEQAQELKIQAPQIPVDNFIIEPVPQGTASVVGLAAKVLSKRDSDAIMVVLPSDHFIKNRKAFHLVIRKAVQVASKDYLVTLGIHPIFPATGFGYIHVGPPIMEKFDFPIYQVVQFEEKPDEAKASSMLADGAHLWNSGIFIWNIHRILKEFSNQMPDLNRSLDRIGMAWGTKDQEEVMRSTWQSLKPETIDFGIMENAENIVVLQSDELDWTDVGAWDSLFDVLKPDQGGNVVVNCDHIHLDTHNSLVYSTERKLVVTIGVDELIIIDSGDALLVCHRDQAQLVRQVLSNLKKTHREEYL
jgi:mannose-1-phosphate guanylyltransferase